MIHELAPLPAAFLGGLSELLGDRMTTSAAVCAHHGKDTSFMPAMPPQAVAYPLDTAWFKDGLQLEPS